MTIDNPFSNVFQNESLLSSASDKDLSMLKEMQRETIKQLHAPLKLEAKNQIVTDGQPKFEEAASETKSAVILIKDQLDSSIKGKWSKAIQKSVKEQADKYDDI